MAHFRLHTENEGEFVIVATINSISSCDNLELSEVSSEFTELERTVIFGLLVKSDGEAEMAVDTENVIGAFAKVNADFQKLLRFGVDDSTAVAEQHTRFVKNLPLFGSPSLSRRKEISSPLFTLIFRSS